MLKSLQMLSMTEQSKGPIEANKALLPNKLSPLPEKKPICNYSQKEGSPHSGCQQTQLVVFVVFARYLNQI